MPRLPALLAIAIAAAWTAGMPPVHADPAPASPGTAAEPKAEEIADPPAYLARIARQRSMLLIGELHGADGAPRLTGDIAETIAQRQPVVIALEWPETEQPAIDAFLASAGGDRDIAALTASAFWHDPRPDGRTSQAMLALLQRLRALKQAGMDVRVVGFDWDWSGDTSGDRDAALADRLRAARAVHPGAAMVALTGNYHARIGRGAP